MAGILFIVRLFSLKKIDTIIFKKLLSRANYLFVWNHSAQASAEWYFNYRIFHGNKPSQYFHFTCSKIILSYNL